METKKPDYVYVTYIATTPEKLWQALMDIDMMALWWVDPNAGCAHVNVSDWKPGSFWEHRRADGSGVVDIVGKVIETAPPRRIVYSWARPGDAADESKHSRVSFDIVPYGNGLVKLTVAHDDLVKDPTMLSAVSGGWPTVLSNLKTFLETGHALPRTVAAEHPNTAKVSAINRSYTGGCACGALRYEVSDVAVFQSHCQCLDCQTRSGTGHGSYLTFPNRKQVKVTGEVKTWDIVADSGNTKTHAFCPTCGSPVYLSFTAMPDLFTIHATSLDEPAKFKPQAVTYTARGHVWDYMDPAILKFYKMPD